MENTGDFGDPFGGGDEEFAFSLTFDDHESVESDVVDVKSVGKVAAGVFTTEWNAGFEFTALYSNACR